MTSAWSARLSCFAMAVGVGLLGASCSRTKAQDGIFLTTRRQGPVTVISSSAQPELLETLASDAAVAIAELKKLFDHASPTVATCQVYWLDRGAWAQAAPAQRLPYGMPFALSGFPAVYLPAVDRAIPEFYLDLVDAIPADSRPPGAKSQEAAIAAYRAIMVHELFHVFWYQSGYPGDPKWLSEGLAQLVVLRSQSWPRFREVSSSWVELNRRLYTHAAASMPVRNLGRVSVLYANATPLNYSWFLAGLFELFGELESRSASPFMRGVLASLPRQNPLSGQPGRLTHARAVSLLSQAAGGGAVNDAWWERWRLDPDSE